MQECIKMCIIFQSTPQYKEDFFRYQVYCPILRRALRCVCYLHTLLIMKYPPMLTIFSFSFFSFFFCFPNCSFLSLSSLFRKSAWNSGSRFGREPAGPLVYVGGLGFGPFLHFGRESEREIDQVFAYTVVVKYLD